MARTITIVSAGFVLVLFFLFFFSHKIIESIVFRPTELNSSFVFSFSKPFEEFFIETEPGVNINIIKFPVKNPRGSILYFHGNKDNLVRWGEIVSQLSVYEYNIYIFDYRGYGKSTGSPSECGVLHDSEVIFNNINQKFPDEHWIFYGRSLGTGIAAYLSSKCKPKGLILESPYYSMEELITHYYFPYPWYDQKITIPTHSYLKESSFPVLILHGTGDQIVPIEEGQKLFHSLRHTRSCMVTIEHGTHDDLAKHDEYRKAIQNFLNN